MNSLRDQTWSMSKLKLLESCPLQFYLKYIIRFQHMDENQDTTARDLGSAIHYTLEMMQTGHTIQEAYELTEGEWRDVVGQENWPKIIDMLPNVRKFNRMMHDRDEQNPFTSVDPEVKMAVNRDWEPVDFHDSSAFFRGVVDYTARRDGDVMIVDYKKGGGGYLTKYHSPQLNSYILLDYYCNQRFDSASAYIYYVEAGELSRGPTIPGGMIESHTRPWLENKIEAAIIAVESEGYFKHSRGNLCKYCDYADLCKGGKRGTCGELINYSIESKDVL